jgi:ferritin-like metal-binding protein YciE
MALFGHEFHSLNELFINQLQDLYDAENRLTEALPKMADAATSSQLKNAFQDHLQQTQNHVTRLEQVFNRLGCEAKRETCDAMKGLIKEGEGMIGAKGDGDTRDAGLIAAAQKVEHYEIAGYGTVRAFAEQLGFSDVAQILQQTLNEESAADRKLTEIAESRVNPESQVH